MRYLVLALLLGGCAAKTDLTNLGAGVGATWNDGPKIGVDASAGKHEVEIQPLFAPAGSAAEGGSGVEAPAAPSAKRFCPN